VGWSSQFDDGGDVTGKSKLDDYGSGLVEAGAGYFSINCNYSAKNLKLTHFFLDRPFRENLNFLLEVQNSLFLRHQA
jgi:hypothetical protein